VFALEASLVMLSFGVPIIVWIVTVYIPFKPENTHEPLPQKIILGTYAFGWCGTAAYGEPQIVTFLLCVIFFN
jgi:hypothetical protein